MRNKAKRLKICIMCKKREKRPKSLFCHTCSQKECFEKIEAFRKSEEYTKGLVRVKQSYGKLPTLLEREMQK